jgi:rubrerythrin
MIDDSLPQDSILGILKSAINIEKFGIRYYTALSLAVDSQDAKELMKYLINAEESHQRFLENVFNKQKDIGDDAKRPLPLDNLDEDGRLAIFSEPLDEVDPAEVGVEEALNYGINVEEKSIKFYNSALKIINDIELKNTLQDLVKFEHEHLDLLKENLDEYRKSGTWRGYIATQ